MSWMVNVRISESPVHGFGVYATNPITKGEIVWHVDETMHFDKLEGLIGLEPSVLHFALHGGYFHQPSQRFVWYEDGSQYINHSESPNIGIHAWTDLMDDHCMALRDIEAGEELFEDYRFWSIFTLPVDHWVRAISRHYCPEHYDFLRSIHLDRQAA